MKSDPEPWPTIPDETPIDDVSGLLIEGIGTRRQLNQVEAENIAIVAVKYLIGRLRPTDAPFTFDWFFELHQEMFGRIWAWAGKPRIYDLNLGCRFFEIEAEVLNLTRDLEFWGTNPAKLIEDAALLHYRAVKIHPFLNGNGRWARMLTNIWLRKHGRRPTEWPEPQIGEESPIRKEYIEAMKAADQHRYSLLIELHERYTPAANADGRPPNE